MKNVCVELSTAVQNCARLEQSLLHNIDVDIYQSNRNISSSVQASIAFWERHSSVVHHIQTKKQLAQSLALPS